MTGRSKPVETSRGRKQRSRWVVDPAPYAATAKLAAELDLHETVASVLVRRGLSEPDRARQFLAADETHDALAFNGIEAAATEILEAAAAGETIALHGDYDADGVCSTALLARVLEDLGADLIARLPNREQGYGLAQTTVDELHRAGATMLITADCGITALAEIEHAQSLGIKVVVTDHHRPGARLPQCSIVHPAICGYPFPELCATAVAYKLAQVLYKVADREPAELESELDLVALATVCDVVPLVGENRMLVRAGLKSIAGGTRPGMRALLRVAGVDPQSATEHTLGFVLGPRINAAGRLYRPDAGLELMLTGDDARAVEIARELDAINRERQSVETEILFEAERALTDSEQRDDPILVLAGEGWHAGVIGIVASRMVERYHRPCVMVALDDQGHGRGSGRSISGYDLHAGLEACSEHLVRFGGHRMAAGLEIEATALDAFRSAIGEHAAGRLGAEDLVRSERVDAVIAGGGLTLELAEQLDCLRPFGMGNPSINLLVPAARLSDARAIGNGRHLRFTATSGGARSQVVAFGMGATAFEQEDVRHDVVARLERNEWQGSVSPRLVLRSLHPIPDRDRETCEACACRATDEEWWSLVWQEFDRPLDLPRSSAAAHGHERVVLDRRGEGVFGSLGLIAASGDSLAIACADVSRRRAVLDRELVLDRFGAGKAETLSERCRRRPPPDAGLLIADYPSLALDPTTLERYQHLVLLDPPAEAGSHEALAATAPSSGGFMHLCWGSPEVEFATRATEAGYSLRDAMRAIYSELKRSGDQLSGEALEQALTGLGPHPRPPSVAGRCLRVLEELGLVELERSSATVRCTITNTKAADLEASEAFRAYTRICQERLQFLNQATNRPSAQRAA